MEKEGAGESSQNVDFSSVKANVKRIKVNGLGRTKNDIVRHHIKPLFAATTFEEMISAINLSKNKFEQLGLFKNMKISIDVSKNSPELPNAYDIAYKVKEQSYLTGGLSTMIGTNEGTMVGSLKLENVWGRGEKVATEFTYGSANAIGANLYLIKPMFFEPHLLLRFSVFQTSGEFPWSSYKETDRGLAVDYTFSNFLGSHTLRWEGIWRELQALSSSTAFAIREESGHSLKSSLKYTWCADTRDSKVLPTFGQLYKFSTELGGLGGDVKFSKHEAEFQLNQPLPLDSTLQFTLSGGVASQDLTIHDRFFLGGPLTLRGFNFKGVGPRIDGCSLGSNIFWCSGLHLYTPLPFRPGKGGFGENFRTHFFINAGNLASFNRELSLKNNIQELIEGYRLSYGLGIVIKLGGIARVEANYCIPLKAQENDSINPGLQLGIGVSFL
ncbi:hypothetical protein HELRODRAFT_185880 [Helobdella robusta]|uniref:Bacterial surface antigen (D15) domain-containing protein n=1 Tax=Helobdella robusta TaxID=6412 RepID=T1FNE1_HELRO|nr:hypothetical protein HELRODRAFT_185880 [Helobdella robusta]ESN98145.1 hypothetical protein HELRODRAFT_185880 [Helobdella robusta]